MPDFNKVIVMGRLTADPELRFTAGGAPVANLRMAINRKWKGQDGQQKEEVCYVTVVTWNKQAEACGEYLKKGSALFVEGRLNSKSWETEAKEKRTALEIVAERVQFLDNKNRPVGDSTPDEGTPVKTETPTEEDIPF